MRMRVESEDPISYRIPMMVIKKKPRLNPLFAQRRLNCRDIFHAVIVIRRAGLLGLSGWQRRIRRALNVREPK